MKHFTLFVLFSFILHLYSNAQMQLTDRFNRNLSVQSIILTDWEGYMANPAILLNVKPPAGAVFPLTVTLSANHSRLYFDMPSTAGINGPVKQLTFTNNNAQSFYVSIFPDRDNIGEAYTLTLQTTAYGNQNFSITVIDQDQTGSNDFNVTVDYSQDNSYQFFSSPAKKNIVQQAADDWSYFIRGVDFDSVAAGVQSVFIWTDNYASGSFVNNNSKYKGYYLYAYGLQVNPNISGGSPANSGFLSIGGVPTNLRRAGSYNADPDGNFNTLGWDTTISDDNWYLATNLGNVKNDLYSIAHHEIGHALNFNPAYPVFGQMKTQGQVNTGDVVAYQGTAIPIDAFDHLSGSSGTLLTDRISRKGLFGSEYANIVPYGRWLLTKADLLVFKANGYTLKNTSAFTTPVITTISLPNGITGGSYNQAVQCSGGIPFYRYEVSSGSLPPGFTINSFTGIISGTPTIGGSYNFTIRVTDYDNVSIQKALSIFVAIDCAIVNQANCARPASLNVTNIAASSARINWSAVTCAVGYQFEWRKKGTIPWLTGQTTGTTRNLTGLLPGTIYQWRVITGCRITPDTVTSNGYVSGPEFTTVPNFMQSTAGTVNLRLIQNTDKIRVSVQNNMQSYDALLINAEGNTVWQSSNLHNPILEIDNCSQLKGIYFLQVSDAHGKAYIKINR